MNEIITLNPTEIISTTGEILSTINTPKTRQVTLVKTPTFEEVMASVPERPNYRGGVRKELTHYGNKIETNRYGTKELKGFNGSIEELIKGIGADFHVAPMTLNAINPVTGTKMELENPYLCNTLTGEPINYKPVTKGYHVLDFDKCVATFYAVVESIRKKGYKCEPDVARVYNGGNRMFLQYKITGEDLLGEPVDTNLTLMTSHDSSLSFMIALTQVRLFCKNCVSRMLKNVDTSVKIRHTKSAKDLIDNTADRVLLNAAQQRTALNEYFDGLSNIKVSDEQIYKTLLAQSGLEVGKEIPSASATKFMNKAQQYFACYNMEDVANWKGTAYGAYLAQSDMVDHVIASRQTETDGDNRIEMALAGGNEKLGSFIDTLVGVAC